MPDKSRIESPTKTRRNTILKGIKRLYVSLGVMAFIGMFVGYQATGFENSVLFSDDAVSVLQTEGLLTFSPKVTVPATALLFLPGAMVDPKAYAPMARAIAKRGYRVSILSLPLRLAPSQSSVAGVITKAAKQGLPNKGCQYHPKRFLDPALGCGRTFKRRTAGSAFRPLTFQPSA